MASASRPLAIDLFCGLGGWTEALLAEGYDVVGFDIERHAYGEHRYPSQLVIQDVLTLRGSQFRDAALIVASPPCQAYSYRAMPWKRAKALPPPDNTLFDACFRIQREASEAAGRHIPMVVENVRGAQKWVGRARWNFGSFYLWGDVPALMPIAKEIIKVPTMGGWYSPGHPKHVRGLGFSAHADRHIKNNGGSWFNIANNTTSGTGRNPATNPAEHGRKGAGAGAAWFDQNLRSLPSALSRRKAASALISKIPFPLARHITAIYHPRQAIKQNRAPMGETSARLGGRGERPDDCRRQLQPMT